MGGHPEETKLSQIQRDGHCHEAVMWYVHHMTADLKEIISMNGFTLPLLSTLTMVPIATLPVTMQLLPCAACTRSRSRAFHATATLCRPRTAGLLLALARRCAFSKHISVQVT